MGILSCAGDAGVGRTPRNLAAFSECQVYHQVRFLWWLLAQSHGVTSKEAARGNRDQGNASSWENFESPGRGKPA